MKRFVRTIAMGLLSIALVSNAAHHKTDSTLDHSAPVAAAIATLDQFMLAFNARDMKRWAATLHYPHVRFASNSVTVWNSAKEFNSRAPFKALTDTGWDHSHWLSRDVVLASPDKVHLATRFARYNTKNEVIGVYESLYIVTRQGERWGIQARSSLAP